MKAIDYLLQIKASDGVIESLIEDIAYLEALATKTTQVLTDDLVQSSGIQQKIAEYAVRIVELNEQLEAEINRLIDCKKVVLELMKECDEKCFRLLYKRYVLFKTWEQIADEMNCSYQWVAGGLHRKALSQFQWAIDGHKTRI